MLRPTANDTSQGRKGNSYKERKRVFLTPAVARWTNVSLVQSAWEK